MKAVSLWQPWASLIGRGKSIETRSWPTSYRGPLAIHAAKHWDGETERICEEEPFVDALMDRVNGTVRMFKPDDLPRGAIVATCTLSGCVATRLTTCRFEEPNWTVVDDFQTLVSLRNEDFGDFSEGRFAWLLSDIQILADPIPCKGRQGLFEVDL